MSRATWALRSPAGRVGPVAIYELAGDVRWACQQLGVRVPGVGGVTLTLVAGVDRALVIRPDARTVLLTPHGGIAVMRALEAQMAAAGLARANQAGDDHGHGQAAGEAAWPEAADEVERRALAALSAVPGALGARVVLAQVRRWREGAAPVPPPIAERLGRLLRPPLVVATGPTNVGKSTLLNALAGRTVARVADRPGVTRDAVAATLELGGLVVRWLDAPGLGAQAGVPRAALELADAMASQADLVLWCQDARARGAGLDAASDHWRAAPMPVATRADLATDDGPPPWAELAVSAAEGGGLGTLSRAVFDRLVGKEAVDHPGAWAFWEALP